MSRELLNKEHVGRLVSLIEERIGGDCPPLRPDLRVVRPQTAQERATEAWRWAEVHAPPANFSDIDQSPRARALREINRIAMRHGWGTAVASAVDKAGATSLHAMTDDAIQALAAHMRHLVDCAESGCDLEDDLPAR